MQRNVKVSVIIPVYNAENHLCQCLDSVIGQTLSDIEIICVDDGSTDQSPGILEEYMLSDPRVKVYNQKNMYAGVARNTGKAHAVGKYLVFWDSDDFFYDTALEKMYLQCEKTGADICVCGGDRYYESIQAIAPTEIYLNTSLLPSSECFNFYSNHNYIFNFTTAVPWNKMFLRSFVEEKQLDFQPIRNGNDVFFVMNAIGMADRITYVNEHLVCYRRNQDYGLVRSVAKSPLSPIQTWIDTKNSLIEHDRFSEQSFANKALDSIIYLLRSTCYSWDALSEMIEILKDHALEDLSVREQEPGYYYNKWQEEYLHHLIHDSTQQFVAFLAFDSYTRYTNYLGKYRAQAVTTRRLKKQCTELSKELSRIKASKSYKLGKVVAWAPKNAFNLLKK